ncbi:hypothetical protein Nepgr_032768 [Nepenthes gracilis]|uniref:Uncharacterized protein n=1 Tax=Nepenthes gracilis TaxID=150966 RepID=A0AAD3TJZ6_NEPGR|nr:hypothetical protein Nepgr_032768 [Nepenthes gracilis]
MGYPSIICNLLPSSVYNLNHHINQTVTLTHSRFLPSKSLLCSGNKVLLPKIRTKGLTSRSYFVPPVIFAAQSNFLRVIQTVIKVGKDGVDAGINLVPDSIPRPVARLAITIAAGVVFLFILRSFLSTIFFALGVMGFVYFLYLALNKDKGPRVDEGPTSPDDAVEEARRIMEKRAGLAILGKCLLMSRGLDLPVICTEGVIIALYRVLLDHQILMEQFWFDLCAYLHSRLSFWVGGLHDGLLLTRPFFCHHCASWDQVTNAY